ncbi:MAG: hypothetical protein KAV42_02505 [Candidatus Krumholzibacteria bacterium]|nr:hypothetical protein [Candidatus Krumholzibacteria bacterium]
MDREKLTELIRENALERDGKKVMPCPKAFMLSREYGVSLKQIGECCNEADIRISNCQLGCFK